MKATFADSFYFLAVLNPRDKDHDLAIEAGRMLVGRLVTTDYVLIEVGDAMARPTDRPRFVRLFDSLSAHENVEIVPASGALLSAGVKLFRERHDKAWSLTDCLSFCAMKERDIEDALTADDHFRQAGFRTLL